ncbi:MAG: type II toxin-antitoxin system HipA family toxin [Bacteroidota bacterium]
MFKPIDLLKITLNEQLVGRMVLNKNNLAVFEYDKEWVENGFSISPFYLPLTAETFVAKQQPFDGLFGVFNDSLPDGWGQLLLDRFLRSKGVDIRTLSVLDRLSLVGKSGMGALSYEPDNEIKFVDEQHNLDFFAKEIEKVLTVQDEDYLELLIAKNGSSAGVRPKVIVRFENELWLVKFPTQYDDSKIGEIEFNCSLMAKKCGIEVPESKLFNGKYFGSKLFDRTIEKRVHVHSASGLLYASHRLPSLDYEDLLKLTRALTNDFTEVEKLFKLMIFNILIKNRDDHAKNFSFKYDNQKWSLTPAYDLTPSYGFNGNHTTTVLGNGTPTESDILKLAKKIGLSIIKAKAIIEEVKEVVLK